MNLSLAINAFYDFSALGDEKKAKDMCKKNNCAMINREISNGVRHYKTHSGETVTSHTMTREREIFGGEGVKTQALFQFQVPVIGGKVDINQVFTGSLTHIMEEASDKTWITPEQCLIIEEQIKQIWPGWTGKPEYC